MPSPKPVLILFTLVLATYATAQDRPHTEMAKVEARPLTRTVPLTAELAPYLQADIEARVPGYVDRVLVDRGTVVRRGQLLVELAAPEMSAQTSAAQASVDQAKADEAQAEAQAAAAWITYGRLQEAAKTPGAVAGNELTQAEKQKDAADAVVESRKAGVKTATDRLRSTTEMQGYLRVTAPFDGVITDRFVHPGMAVDSGGHQPLLKLQQVSHLRLVVPVPEAYTVTIARGKNVTFRVAAQPNRTYTGSIARIPKSVDQQTRSMMVELDVVNRDQSLAPGMYAIVDWPVSSGGGLLFVPATSVVTTTERTFVITSNNGKAHWIDVQKGPVSGDLVAVRGPLTAGESVVKRATDEMREGNPIQ